MMIVHRPHIVMYYCYYHYCICIYIGAETTAKLTKMKVLIYGLRGIGVETCKNLALQGVGAITVSGDDAVVDDSMMIVMIVMLLLIVLMMIVMMMMIV